MARIYVSHSSLDHKLAQDISSRLSEIGHELWADNYLKAGVDLRLKLRETLSTVDAILVLITKESANSRWVSSEVSAMRAYAKERGRGGVIPVWFDDVELPESVRDIQAIRANRNDLSGLISNISNAVENIVGATLAKEEKRKERRELLERVASDFIEKSQENLQKRERSYKNQANIWYFVSCSVLILGAGTSFWRAASINYNESNLFSLLEVVVLGAISVGLIVGIAKFAFTLGKSFMVESLRNADRSHAISFGEFYLRSYGSDSDWTELKEAFQHWNIDTGSVFSSQKAEDFDPKVLETALALAKLLSDAPKPK